MSKSSEICEVMWHTGEPAHDEPCMVTVKLGGSRWVLPECKFIRNRWYHLIVEEHDRPVDDQEIMTERIDEQWERVELPVLAWAEYPEAYTGEA